MMGFGWQACTLAAMAAASVWASLIPVEIPPDAGLPGLRNGTSEGANLTNSTSCSGPGEGHLGHAGSSGSGPEEPASAGDWLSGFKEWLTSSGGPLWTQLLGQGWLMVLRRYNPAGNHWRLGGLLCALALIVRTAYTRGASMSTLAQVAG